MPDQLPEMSEQQVDLEPARKPRGKLWAVLLIGLLALIAVGISWSSGNREPETVAEQASLPDAADMEAPNILAEDMRQFIWDVEHIAFEMEAKILPQVKQALTEPNAALLSRFLSPGFRGKVPSEDWQVVASANDWQIRRKEIFS